ncbi:rRNA pseudouridine synthase [Alicyclobacillus curvatus]|nr:rRNA pseudouridine synthase [Alicyclobacillus curvatus]
MTERLQKFLARAGVASRRKCEELIVAGDVEVDGRVVSELGTVIDPLRQKVKVRGQAVSAEPVVCAVLHKPVSYVTTVSDPEGRRTVLDLVAGINARVYPVGRLDYDTSGLLLLSNDGELTYRLLHPKHHVDKVYRATVLDMPSAEALRQLQTGIVLEDGITSPAVTHVLRNHPKESVIEITIHEGKNRQIRRMFEAIGHPVKRLKRIQFGPLELGTLPTGEWRLLTAAEQKALYETVGMVPPEPPVPKQAQTTTKNRPRKRS